MIKADRIYRHAELTSVQACKKNLRVCGDFIAEDRTPEAATFMVCDGIGSGIKANVAARLYSARLLELLKGGFSLRQACASLVDTMHAARTEDILFAAFTLVRILNDGSATVISYEMPAPVFIDNGTASVARQRFFTMSHEVVGESSFVLKPGDGILVVSDGISQAGMGTQSGMWNIEGVRDFVRRELSGGAQLSDLPGLAVREAYRRSGNVYGDDATAALFSCRPGASLRILTGPPASRADDTAVIDGFLSSDGMKIVCGSSTADLVARHMGRSVETAAMHSNFEPPEYFIDGIDLVTEGSLTLNQLYNIVSEKPADLDPASPVTKLLSLMRGADRIYFMIGCAKNPGHDAIIFRQLGVMPRQTVVPLIAEKLRAEGKLVIISRV